MRRTILVPLVAIVAAAAIASPARAFRSGPPAAETGGPGSNGNTCRGCHGNNSGGGMVEILGAPTRYVANRVYNITVRVSDPVQAGAGFELSVENPAGGHIGTLVLSDPMHTRFATTSPQNAFWIEHNGAGVDDAVANWLANGRSASYHIQWQAPASDAGPIKFWAAGNAINNNFTSSGDIIYLTNLSATFNTCPADLSGDGVVNAADLALLLGGWAGSGDADLNNDGTVNSADLALLLGAWGACP